MSSAHPPDKKVLRALVVLVRPLTHKVHTRRGTDIINSTPKAAQIQYTRTNQQHYFY